MELSGTSSEIAQEYSSSLADLTVNSKPLISMLTMLAEDNLHHAAAIVQAVEKHLVKVEPEYKLPVLYLIDSIVKNIGQAYTNLFTQNIVSTFCGVFEKVDEKVRAQMFKLRHTWNEMFPAKKLYAIDLRVKSIDPAWPIHVPAPVSIHVNPKFLNKKTEDSEHLQNVEPQKSSSSEASTASGATPGVSPAVKMAANELDLSLFTEARMREELLRKQKELIELQEKKLELELLQAKAQLEEQKRQLQQKHAAALADTVTAQQLLPIVSTQQAKLLTEQKMKAPAAAVTRSSILPTSQPIQTTQHQQTPLFKNHSQALSSFVSTQKPLNQQRQSVLDPRRAASTPEINPHTTQISQTHVMVDSKPKIPSIIPSASITNNKDFKAGSKDTFLNKDPRNLNKRISPVPKSMAMLVTNKDRLTSFPNTQDNMPAAKPSPSKQKPVLTTKPTSPSFPAKGMTEVPVESVSNEIDVGGSKQSTGIVKETKHVRQVESSKSSSSSTAKKLSGKSTKKSFGSSSSGKPETNSKTVEQRKITKTSDITEDRSLKSPKNSSKSKESRKTLDKKKDRKRDSESASVSKSPGSPTKSKSDLKSGRVFKDVKGCRSRNYIRHRSISESPEPISESGDVDLRNGPLDIKIPRITVFKDDLDAPSAKPGISPPGPPFQLEGVSKSPEVSQDAQAKDVDLRQLSTSPLGVNKKRGASIEKSDYPSPKKSKAEMIDVLFGNEDVDLRTLAPPIPPPMDMMAEEHVEKKKAPDWARFKEVNPDTYKSPLKNSWETSSEHGSQASDLEVPVTRPSPDVKPILSTPKDKPTFDRLGRPLLYNRISVDEPRERRCSISSQTTGEDTDMRHLATMEPDTGDELESNPSNINIIIAQADEQLTNGTISYTQYNTLLKQMVRLNEVQKLREAQRRDEQENWDDSGSDGWDQDRGSQSPDSDSRSRDSDMASKRSMKYRGYENEGAIDENQFPQGDKFVSHGDIDERFGPPAARRDSGMQHPLHGRGRSMLLRGGPSGYSHPVRGHMGRPWPDSHPGGPHPSWKESGSGWHQSPQGPMSHHIDPHPSVPPHMTGPRPPHFRRGGGGDFGPRFSQWQQQEQFNQGRMYPFAQDNRFRQHSRGELPPVDPRELEMIEQDSMRTINIDQTPREIRYYGDTAIIMMSWDDPREISFQAGSRRITFNDRETITLNFGDNYREVVIDGVLINVKLGSPTRELLIDGRWYAGLFGGPPITVDLKGNRCKVQLEGPIPQVKIGDTRRNDLVAGKVKLIVDADDMTPIFLDPKPQKFVIHGKPHILRFTDAFTTVIINGHKFRPNFGGLPMPIIVQGNKHWVGFSALPPGIVPGYVNIKNMDGGRLPTPPPGEEVHREFPPQQPVQIPVQKPQIDQGHQPALPIIGRGRRSQFEQQSHVPTQVGDQMRGLTRITQQHATPGLRHRGQLDVLTSLMPGVMTVDQGYSYQVQQDAQQLEKQTVVPAPAVPAADSTSGAIPLLNLDKLMQKLVSTGLLPSKDTAEVKQEEDTKIIKPVTFTNESLKLRQAGVYTALYSGIQCSSCGVRFPPEQTIKYSQHLDWHFRQNRRERDSAKKAQSRKWYYDVSDWIQFEEIEDLEERAQSWFETQVVEKPEEREHEMQSVPAGENSEAIQCAMCHERFEQFYNEDKEEWHLRDALRVEDKTYHPVCYEDYKNAADTSLDESLTQSEIAQESEKVPENVEAIDTEEKKEDAVKEEKITDDDVSNPVHDVVIKEEPMDEDTDNITTTVEPMDTSEEIVVKTEPDVDTNVVHNEETIIDIDVSHIKSESVEISEPTEPESSAVLTTVVDTTLNIVTSSIDGNMELGETAPVSAPTSKIKINISKPIIPVVPTPVVRADSQSDDDTSAAEGEIAKGDVSEQQALASVSSPAAPTAATDELMDDDAPPPPPPGEDTLHLKPRLVGRKFTEYPPVCKGSELSSLCSIM